MKFLNDIAKQMQDKDIISFDVFDTLLERDVVSPKDIFRLIEKSDLVKLLNVNNFSKLRIKAEKEVRDLANINNIEEITLNDIYNKLATYINLDVRDIEKLKDLELNTEINHIKARKIGYKLFDMAKLFYKKIVLITDMYLPKEFIVKLLKLNGYSNWDCLYVSSEFKLSKRTGSLFNKVISIENIEPCKILHIGDNFNGDFEQPNKVGIVSVYLKTDVEKAKNNFTFTKNIFSKYANYPTIENSFLLKYFCNTIFSESFDTNKGAFNNDPYLFGRAVLGPIGTCFSIWMNNVCKERKISKILFLSRDSKFIYDIYKEIFLDDGCAFYVKSSRRISNICMIYNAFDIEHFILTKPIYSQTLHHYLKFNFALTEDDLQNIENFDIGTKTPKVKIIKIAEQLKVRILERTQHVRDTYISYLKQYITTDDRVAIVDIGYAGTVQETFISLFKQPIFGIYLAKDIQILNKNISDTLYSSYIPDYLDKSSARGIVKHRFIYESVFCSSENSFLEMSMTDNMFVPIESYFDEPNRKNFVLLAHKGAIDSVAILSKFLTNEEVNINSQFCFDFLDEFLKNPPLHDLTLFNGCEFEDKVAPALKRVIIDMDNMRLEDTKIRELWTEGVSVREINIRKIASSKLVKVNDCFKTEPEQSNNLHEENQSLAKHIYFYFEDKIVNLVSSKQKYIKYKKNRKIYFLDSKSKLLRKLSWIS